MHRQILPLKAIKLAGPPLQQYDFVDIREKSTFGFEPDQIRGLGRQFSRKRQLRRLLVAGLSRWLMTAVTTTSLYVTLWYFSNKPIMTNDTKRRFNAIITGLSIALGLSIANSLKAMATELRWWILSRRERSLREVTLILHADSLSHMIQLGTISRRFSVRVSVVLWLLLNIASQIGVATLGLTYSVDRADKNALLIPGNVSIPDMSRIETEKVVKSQVRFTGAEQYTANSYGIIALAYDWADVETLPRPGSLWSPTHPLIFCGQDYCQYVFHETSIFSDQTAEGLPIAISTNRNVISVGVCQSWPVSNGGNGTTYNITLEADPNSRQPDVEIPIAGGIDQTTYMTDTSIDCGPSCSRVSAFEASATAPWYYECNVSISAVANATRKEHNVGHNLTALASSAIALQGYASSSLVQDSKRQYQLYPAESVYGTPQMGDQAGMGLLMARFAMGVVAVAAEYNQPFIVPGAMPVAGVTLNVTHWEWVHVILGLTAGLQLALAVATALVANRVVVGRSGALATARLLRPIVDKLGSGGSLAKDKDIAEAFGSETKYVYKVRRSSTEGVHRVHLGEGPPTRRFPEGWYE